MVKKALLVSKLALVVVSAFGLGSLVFGYGQQNHYGYGNQINPGFGSGHHHHVYGSHHHGGYKWVNKM